MSDWPPKVPNHQPDETRNISSTQQSQNLSTQQWQLLEKVLLASSKEQTLARRWGIFFKILTFIYLLIVLLVMGKGCSVSDEQLARSEKHLAVVDIIGTIDASSSQGVDSTMTNAALKEAFEDSNSRAIALNINSPGGSPVQSDEIWQEIRFLKQKHPDKKVYAVISDTGASGAYYIASAADEIWVNRSSLVGSIGVIMPSFGVSGLLQKWGIDDRTLTAGENKNLMSMTQPINATQRQHMQNLLNNVHQHFINAVKEGRGDRLKANPEIFSGLVWTGEQAVELGIADKIGSISTLKRSLELEYEANYTIPASPLEQLLGKVGTSIGFGLGSSVQQSLQQNLK